MPGTFTRESSDESAVLDLKWVARSHGHALLNPVNDLGPDKLKKPLGSHETREIAIRVPEGTFWAPGHLHVSSSQIIM